MSTTDEIQLTSLLCEGKNTRHGYYKDKTLTKMKNHLHS